MTRRSTLLLAALAAALTLGSAWGHFPVLEPVAAVADPGDTVTVQYSIGHLFANDRFDVQKPYRVRLYPPAAYTGHSIDLTAAITSAGTPEVRSYRVSFQTKHEGDYVLGFEGGMFSEPPARKVEDFSKMVLHVRGAQMGWWRRLGYPIEIMPLTRPYDIPVGATFRGRVLLDGQPYPDAFVEVETTARPGDPTPFELSEYRREERTGPDGCYSVTFDKPGWWVMAVATDGGPGMQGTSPHPARRAVFPVFVGPWDESYRRVFPQ